MASIVSTIPSIIGTSGAAGSDIYTDSGLNYDYAIGGLPFKSGASRDIPMERKTAPYRKPPNDQSPEPGEQSLAFWWIKAQSSFHGGAGQLYIDTPVPQGAEIRPVRYQISAGINPWNQGKISLLKTTSLAASVTSSTASCLMTMSVGGSSRIIWADGTSVFMTTETLSTDGNGNSIPSYSAAVTVTTGATTAITSLASDGTFIYATDGTGIWKCDPTTPGTIGTKIYALTSGKAVLSWVKQRLMLGYTTATVSAVYELDNKAAANSALPTAKYTQPNPAWVWTSFTEGPSAIYAAGFAGFTSSIYKFVLDTNGAVPTLTGGLVVATMPPGEIIYAISSYLNTCIGIQTSRGFRIGQYNTASASGEFQHGPLSVTQTVTAGAVAGSDRFMYCAYTDSSGVAGVARIDASQQLTIRAFSYTPDMRFAWAPDLRATNNSDQFVAGKTTAIDVLGDRIVFLVPGQGVFVEHPSFLTPTGSLTTSRIRYETLDPKLVRYLRVRTEGTAGSYSLQVNQNADSGGPLIGTLPVASQPDSGDVAVSLGKLQFATVTLGLTRDTSNKALAPAMLGYQLKALPGQTRQRLIQVPLSCFDRELDSSGAEMGGDGTALARLLALEALESAGDIVQFQVLSPYPDNTYTVLAVIDDVDFRQTSIPTDTKGWGGIAVVTLRTVT